eukprot:13040287-Alexandrium_andersonii.AAC.1
MSTFQFWIFGRPLPSRSEEGVFRYFMAAWRHESPCQGSRASGAGRTRFCARVWWMDGLSSQG